MKRIVCTMITLVMALFLLSAHAEKVTLNGFSITTPDGWTISNSNDTTIVLSNSAKFQTLEIYSVPVLSIIPEEERALMEILLPYMNDQMLLETVKSAFELMYETTAILETVHNKQVLYMTIEANSLSAGLVTMIHNSNIIAVFGLDIFGSSEKLCKEVVNWISFPEESSSEQGFDEKHTNQGTSATNTDEPQIDPDELSEFVSASSSNETVFAIKDGYMTITLNEDKFNVFTTNNLETSKSVQRSSMSADRWNTYMSLKTLEIMIAPIEKDILNYSVQVRIKEDNYADIGNYKTAPKAVVNSHMHGLSLGFGLAGTTGYETYETDQALYCVLDCKISDSYQKRYATVYDDDMIYIWLSSTEPITEEGEAFLKEIVDLFVYR